MVLLVLGLLALLLLIGNAYLYFFPGTEQHSYKSNDYYIEQLEAWERSLNTLHEKNFEFERKIIAQEKAMARKLRVLDTSILNLDSKTEEALKRIGRIESILSAKAMPSRTNLLIARKIERLEDFRRNAIIEIEAIKEQLPELKKKKQTKNPSLEEKIHNLVFHGKSSN